MSPRWRSNETGTRGNSRSAASGTPKNAIAAIDTIAASDQPTMRAFCLPVVRSVSRWRARKRISACVVGSSTSSRANGRAERHLSRNHGAQIVEGPRCDDAAAFADFEIGAEAENDRMSTIGEAVEIGWDLGGIRRNAASFCLRTRQHRVHRQNLLREHWQECPGQQRPRQVRDYERS